MDLKHVNDVERKDRVKLVCKIFTFFHDFVYYIKDIVLSNEIKKSKNGKERCEKRR